MSRERLLRLKQILGDPKAKPPIEGIVPVSRSTWYRNVQNGLFPKSISISPRCVAWKASDIEELLNSWEETSDRPRYKQVSRKAKETYA
jgi:prophage regulatory protein